METDWFLHPERIRPMRYLKILSAPGYMGDVYGEGTSGHGEGQDRPGLRQRYTVDADLDTLMAELSTRLGSVTERGYPVSGTYGPTRAIPTPITVRCYDVGEDAALRVSHDTQPRDAGYMSRVTLHADTTERLEELHDEVDTVMAAFGVEEHGLFERILAPLLDASR